MDNLYEKYGKLMIQLEILQSQIQACKRDIVEETRKQKDEKGEK